MYHYAPGLLACNSYQKYAIRHLESECDLKCAIIIAHGSSVEIIKSVPNSQAINTSPYIYTIFALSALGACIKVKIGGACYNRYYLASYTLKYGNAVVNNHLTCHGPQLQYF